MSDIPTFVRQLLSRPPGDAHSIDLEMDVEGDIVALFEMLLTIMTEVLKTWYSPPIHISRITEKDLTKLLQYFASFGIRMEVKTEPIPRVLRINNKAYEYKTRLEDMTFQMTSADTLYTVSFAAL
jgi:hypothetical protein